MFKNEPNIKRMTERQDAIQSDPYSQVEKIARERFSFLLHDTLQRFHDGSFAREISENDRAVALLCIALDILPKVGVSKHDSDRLKQRQLRQRDQIRAATKDETLSSYVTVPKALDDLAILRRCFPHAQVEWGSEHIQALTKVFAATALPRSVAAGTLAEAFLYAKCIHPALEARRDLARRMSSRLSALIQIVYTTEEINRETLRELSRTLVYSRLTGVEIPEQSPVFWKKCIDCAKRLQINPETAKDIAFLLFALVPQLSLTSDGLHVTKPAPQHAAGAPMPIPRAI